MMSSRQASAVSVQVLPFSQWLAPASAGSSQIASTAASVGSPSDAASEVLGLCRLEARGQTLVSSCSLAAL